MTADPIEESIKSAEKVSRHVYVISLYEGITEGQSRVLQAADANLRATAAALRAVMELHKPDEDGEYCDGCMNALGDPCYYPCPTIQAIQEVYGDADQV